MAARLKLNKAQTDRLSEITGNLGLVLLASLVLPVFTGSPSVDPLVMLIGTMLALFCVIVSLILLKGGNK